MARFFYVTSIIMMTLSGGCTALFVLFGLGAEGFFDLAIIALFAGGLPFLFFLFISKAARDHMRKPTWKPGGGKDES